MINNPMFVLLFWMISMAAAHLGVFFLCGLHKRTPEISPANIGSLPSGESDPSVTLDFRGADTVIGAIFTCLECEENYQV
jgi:hypothetical protein